VCLYQAKHAPTLLALFLWANLMSTPDFHALAQAARAAQQVLARASAAQRTQALMAMASAVRTAQDDILHANAQDLAAASALSAPLRDRLTLDLARVEAMATGIEAIARQPDPLGHEDERWTRPNGLVFSRVRVPLGVIGIIYESRPNVTADAGALCLRSGNACILRGGSDSLNSSRAIHQALQAGLHAANLPPAAITLIDSPDRALVRRDDARAWPD
jgi:glutamate-5-semialdehyde dehydrogenase